MCDINKNVTKMGVIIKGVYYTNVEQISKKRSKLTRVSSQSSP